MANFEKGIGLNADQLHKDIEEFYAAVGEVGTELLDVFTEMFLGLRNKWASPDAKTKSYDWNIIFFSILSNLWGDERVTIDKVEDAAQLIANSLGTSYERIKDNIEMDYANGKDLDIIDGEALQYVCLESFSDGTVAMDVESIKFILDLFNKRIEKVYTLMDAVPDRINIYDTNGDIQTGFSCRIKELKEKLVEGVRTLNIELKSYMDQYIADLMSAKAKAESEVQN